ncbi:MAG TPA: cytochrome P450, partial [Candidatus Nanopelagicales bacterium]|nr:cytochrome P450 [Candidatus Nanopelagicales bacterium]
TPLLLLRMATADAQLGPYPLPPGAGVVLSPLITQRNPDLYPDPDRFRPERWTRLSPGPYEYLPFGAGPRMCLGAGFANLTLRLSLSLILQRFRLSLAHRARISTVIRGITMGPRHGLPMLIAPQDRYFRRAEEVRGDIGELVNLS